LNGNLLSTTEGKATKSRSLNLKNNNNASFSMKFDMPNRLFLTNSRIGKKLRVKFILKIDGKVVINVYKEFTAGNAGSGGGNSPKSDKDKKPKSTPEKHDHDRYTSENSQWEESCPICNGTGVCNNCWGAGQYYSPAAKMMWPCSACYSSGKCRMCNGKGKNVYRVYTVNGIRYMQVNSDALRVLGGGDDGHRCGACSGLGRCAVCQGSGSGVSYSGSAPVCSACNGTGRCSKCGGSGWR
ncbi:MAG: hypothetical protein K2L73_06345, partial [Muribaculaceae bacterium]|nr:hypothetical protein [Muribaculaceae bacterium]